MYQVYILRNIKNHLYVGCTENIEARIKRHNMGDGAELTRRNKDFTLVYTETFNTPITKKLLDLLFALWNT